MDVSPAMTECPKCGEDSYMGGHCFHCGVLRPQSKKNHPKTEQDSAEFMTKNMGYRLKYLNG